MSKYQLDTGRLRFSNTSRAWGLVQELSGEEGLTVEPEEEPGCLVFFEAEGPGEILSRHSVGGLDLSENLNL